MGVFGDAVVAFSEVDGGEYDEDPADDKRKYDAADKGGEGAEEIAGIGISHGAEAGEPGKTAR